MVQRPGDSRSNAGYSGSAGPSATVENGKWSSASFLNAFKGASSPGATSGAACTAHTGVFTASDPNPDRSETIPSDAVFGSRRRDAGIFTSRQRTCFPVATAFSWSEPVYTNYFGKTNFSLGR